MRTWVHWYPAKKKRKLAQEMKDSSKGYFRQNLFIRLQLVVLLSWLGLVGLGQVAESGWGWVSCPPHPVVLMVVGRRRRAGRLRCPHKGEGEGHGWRCHLRTWRVPLLRSLLLLGLWLGSGRVGPGWVVGLPWLVWGWQVSGRVWPGLGQQPEWRGVSWLLWQGQRVVVWSYLGLGLSQMWQAGHQAVGVSLGCVVCGRSEPWVEVERPAEGGYQVELCGHFRLRVKGDEPFRMRVLILFLRLLEVDGPERQIGRTRDDRAPFVRQTQVAAWFEVPQPNVSRWERYWQSGAWADLLSLKSAEVLTTEVRTRIIQVFAAFPWWGVAQVYAHLQAQAQAITERQVRQTAEESGWSQLRQELVRRYHLSADSFRPQENWVVGQLLALVEGLLTHLEEGSPLTPQQQLEVADLQTLVAATGLTPAPTLKALPWLLRVEQVVFGQWQAVEDGQVRCSYCGSAHVVRKSKQPRLKKYYDAQGQLVTVAVYRYYCRHKACDKGSFTHLPPGLGPYSPYRTETKLLALQMYAWGYSTYRRTGQALGVTSFTVYRWVSAWGYELLPVAALFGLVKSSGVVGVDEKYVLVPKNDKPAGKMRRWMYVYLAVDVYTYDLLHLAIYPNNDQTTALTFLFALRAKGYRPRVIVTDLRRDYGADIAQVFPQATHHECIFHALQDISDLCRHIYGTDYAQTQPQVEVLRLAIVQTFQAKTKRTAQKRYEAVLTLREQFVRDNSEAAAIFNFLERHWPTLVNAIESDLIPRTNNTVELVIRRFDQHYQNFCGFDSIDTAHLFLAVFEKLYRFTPFSADAQPGIRGKCPLELAGYDISQLPMTSLCRGFSFDWPMEVTHSDVPK